MTDTLESQVFDTISIRGVEKPFASLSSVSMLDSAQRQLLLASGTYLGREVPSGGLYMSDGGHVDVFTKTAITPSWVQHNIPSYYIYDVVYGDGKFVMPGYQSNKAYYSTDGINWSTATLPSSLYWNAIGYGNGTFVITPIDSNVALYSTNGGLNWTTTSLPESKRWLSIAYGADKFIALPGYNDTQTAAYSSDGTTWTSLDLPESHRYNGIVYGGGKFVIVGYTNVVLYSTDGLTWNTSTMPYNTDWRSVAYGNGMFVAVDGSAMSNHAAYSTDGITWHATTLPEKVWNANWTSVTFGNDKFIAVSGNTSTNVSAVSLDGITWTSLTLPSSRSWGKVAYGDNKFLAIDTQGYSATLSAVTDYEYSLTPVAYGKSETDAQLSTKQDTLTAGTNINIDANNVITATQTYDSATETIVF